MVRGGPCRVGELAGQALGVLDVDAQARVVQRHGRENHVQRLAGGPGDLAAGRSRDREVALGVLEVPVLQTAAGDGGRQPRVGGDDVGGQLRHRAAHRGGPAAQEQLEPVLGDQAACLLPVLAGEGVADRGHRLALLGVPARRAAVQEGDLLGVRVAQVRAQQLAEQRVVAVPVALGVGRCHRRPEVLDRRECERGALVAGQGVGQLGADGVHEAGPQHELAPVPRQAGENLGDEVVRHRPVGAGELGQEARRLGVPVQRERRQAQGRGPALGARPQQVGLRAGEGEVELPAQLGRLPAIEREVPDAQLRERAVDAQPLDRQRRVGAAGEHDPQLLGGVAHQEVDCRGRLGTRQLVDLVEHEHQRGVQFGEAVDEQRQEALRARPHRRLQPAEGAAGLDQLRAAQRVQQVLEQPAGVVVIPVQRQPARRARQLAGRDPRGEQYGLAGPGRRGEQHEALADSLVQGVEEPPALNQVARGRRDQQLGGHSRGRRRPLRWGA